MTKLETVRDLNDSGPQLQIVESVRMLQQSLSLMHEDLRRLPGAISTETAQALEPLDKIAQTTSELQQMIERLAHDRVQRAMSMARNQHQKAMRASKAADGWMREAKSSRKEKAAMQAQIQSLTLRFWIATGSAATLFAVLLLMILVRI